MSLMTREEIVLTETIKTHTEPLKQEIEDLKEQLNNLRHVIARLERGERVCL